MSLKKRLLTAAALAGVAAAALLVGISGKMVSKEQTEESIFTKQKETLYFWYADEALTDYRNSAAVAYGESHDVRVIPVLTSGLEYLESINKASIQSETPPDLYVVSNDSLERAFLAGLASPVDEGEWEEIKDKFDELQTVLPDEMNEEVFDKWDDILDNIEEYIDEIESLIDEAKDIEDEE